MGGRVITVNQPRERLGEVIGAFREAGGEGKPVRLQVHLSYEPDSERAPAIAHDQWREACIGSGVGWELEMPEEFGQVGAYIRPEDVRESVLVTDDLGWLPESIAAMGELGTDEIDLHGAGQDQDAFLEATGSRLLPALAAGL